MKKLLSIVFAGLCAGNLFAQAPQGIPYQAIARNASGQAIASTAVKVRFSIRDSIATGAIKYQETHNPTTSALGLFSVNVGMGTVVSGTFSGINWGKNAKFLQVEMDPAGGATFTDLGTTQMMSVPYALYAGSASNNSVINPPGFESTTRINPDLPILGANNGCMSIGSTNDEELIDAVSDGNSGYWILYRSLNPSAHKVIRINSLGSIIKKFSITSALFKEGSILNMIYSSESKILSFIGVSYDQINAMIAQIDENGSCLRAFLYSNIDFGGDFYLQKSGFGYVFSTFRNVVVLDSSFQVIASKKTSTTNQTCIDRVIGMDNSIYIGYNSIQNGNYLITKFNADFSPIWTKDLGAVQNYYGKIRIDANNNLGVTFQAYHGVVRFTLISSEGNLLNQKDISINSFLPCISPNCGLQVNDLQFSADGSALISGNVAGKSFFIKGNSSNTAFYSLISRDIQLNLQEREIFVKSLPIGTGTLIFGNSSYSGNGGGDLKIMKISGNQSSCCLSSSGTSINTPNVFSVATNPISFITNTLSRTVGPSTGTSSCDAFIKSTCFE